MTHSKYQVRSIGAAFDHACAGLGFAHTGLGANEVTKRLNADPRLALRVTDHLKSMGQHHLINLTHTYDEACMALAFYAGNGIVAKVIPEDFFDHSKPVYQMPPITYDRIANDDECSGLIVATYPWLAQSLITMRDLDQHQITINSLGMDFGNGDKSDKNFRRIPDRNGTITSIDSSAYKGVNNGKTTPPHAYTAWHDAYIPEIYPIYKTGEILPQDNKTDFTFKSIHNPNHGIAGFDHTKENPIIRAAPKPQRTFWQNLFSSPSEAEPSF